MQVSRVLERNQRCCVLSEIPLKAGFLEGKPAQTPVTSGYTYAGFALAGLVMALCLVSPLQMQAKVKVEEYLLRVHLFETKGTATFYGGLLDHTQGRGIGNLFENGEARAFQFEYNCGEQLHMTDGYETYPAKWKKPGGVLEIVTPVPGKPNALHTCELKVVMKQDSVFVAVRSHDGVNVMLVKAAGYKNWMQKEGYDPEHGKDTPLHPLMLNGVPVQ